jgi:NAD(P)-dependent dehydrogenase (short-subunit alcohol dehydrogenase family)
VLPATLLAQQIIQELLTPDSEIEVGYPQGQRTIFASTLSPLSPSAPTQEQPTQDWVVFVTGGNRGITAEVLKALVVPGMTLILVGRSPIPPAESAATCHIQELGQLRQQLLIQAKAEGRTATPRQIEQDLNALINARQSRQNLDWLRQRCRVEYHALDVRDAESLAQLVKSVYSRYGRIDCLIHGAGAIEDKLIVDKTMASFNRVFDTKVDSAFCLSRCLRPESLKHLVFFASVAGRYGNRGQVDYAAANEVMTRLAWQLGQRWPTTRVTAIQWGPWDTTGMASPAVKEKFRSQGVIPIPLAAGSQYFVRELLFGSKGDTEIIAGEGPWCRDSRQPQLSESSQTTLPKADRALTLALISQAPELQSNSAFTLRHVFSQARDPYLRHHRLDGKPVLPVAAAAEWLAEFVQAAWPEWTVTEILDLQMLGGVVLADDDAELPVIFQAKATMSSATSLHVTADILEESNRRSLYRAAIKLEAGWGSVGQGHHGHQQQTTAIAPSAPLRQGKTLTAQLAYDRYLFHGPRFQLLTAIHRLSPTGIDASCLVSSPQDWLGIQNSAWLFDPGLLDLGPQLAAVWSQEIHKTYALPTRFGRIVRYSAPSAQPLTIHFRIQSHTPNFLSYNAMFITPDRQVVMLVENVESNCTAALNRLGEQSSI